MKKIILTTLISITSLYSDNNIIILNEGVDSDVLELKIKGTSESCRLDFESSGAIYNNTCSTTINSKGTKVYCTPKKQSCKTYDEIYAFIFEPPSPPISHDNSSKFDTSTIQKTVQNTVNSLLKEEEQGNALPITENNLNEYIQRMNNAARSIALGDSQIHKAIKVYKKPLEEMGYNFDDTILNTTKILHRTKSGSQLGYRTYEIWNNIVQLILINPELSVTEGFVGKETRDKILIFDKFKALKDDDIRALAYVIQCQKQYDGVCYASQYAQILLDRKFVTSKYEGFSPEMQRNFEERDRLNSNAYQESEVKNEWVISVLMRKLSNKFWKYLIYMDGSDVRNDLFLDDMRDMKEKAFKIKEEEYRNLAQYNPWWKR